MMHRNKKALALLCLAALCLTLLTGCGSKKAKNALCLDYFDTVIEVSAWDMDEARFQEFRTLSEQCFQEYHRLFDRYHAYDGLSNLKTVNDQAGAGPVQVPQPLFDLIEQGLASAQETAKRARAEYDKLVEDKAPYAVCRTAECTLIGSDFMLGMSQSVERAGSLEKILMEELPLEAMAIRLGDCVIMGVSCENFIEISQAVKRDSPFRYTMMSSLTNGNTRGYICADYAYDEFCYEAQASSFAKGAVQALVDGCLQAIYNVQ